MLIAFGFLYSVYTYILAPDATVYTGLNNFKALYEYNYKIQREYLIYAFLVVAIFFAIPSLIRLTKRVLKKYTSVKVAQNTSVAFGVTLIGGLIFIIYTPINVESSGVAANVGAFRQAISRGESSCVPLPPTPGYFKTNTSIWRFEYNTVCYTYNASLSPDYDNFNAHLINGKTVVLHNVTKSPLKTFYVVVKNNENTTSSKLVLRDISSGKKYYAELPAKSSEKFSYIPIRIADIAYRETYNLVLSSTSPSVYWGAFKENGEPAYYPMYGDTNPPTPYR